MPLVHFSNILVGIYRKNSFNPKVIDVALLGAKMECGSSILVFEFSGIP